MTFLKMAAVAAVMCSAAPAPRPVAAPAPQGRPRASIERAIQMAMGGPQIGVSVRDADDTDTRGGIIVDRVRDGSPAAKAGVKDGDRILEFDGERVRSVSQFRRLVQETPAGRKVQIAVQRGTERVTLSVEPEREGGTYLGGDFGLMPIPPAPPAPPAAPRGPIPPLAPYAPPNTFGGFLFRSGDGRLGITVEDLSNDLCDYFGVKSGVLVRVVQKGSAAEKAGVKAGDVITSINGHRVEEPRDLSRELNRADDGAAFTLEITRDRKTQTVKGTLGARDGWRDRWVS